MLKISTTSWHYRLWRFGRTYSSKPKNLCQYFWHIALIKILFPLVLAGFVVLGVISLIYVIWGHPVESGLIVLAGITGVLVIVSLIKFGQVQVEKMEERRRARLFGPPIEPKQPGVVRTFLKARKQKMCPLIEVVDD